MCVQKTMSQLLFKRQYKINKKLVSFTFILGHSIVFALALRLPLAFSLAFLFLAFVIQAPLPVTQ